VKERSGKTLARYIVTAAYKWRNSRLKEGLIKRKEKLQKEEPQSWLMGGGGVQTIQKIYGLAKDVRSPLT